MKIIGKTAAGDSGDFIVTLPREEAYNLIGHSSHYSSNRVLAVGDSIKITAMWERMMTMKKTEADLEKAAKLLRASAELLEMALPAVHRANVKEREAVDADN